MIPGRALRLLPLLAVITLMAAGPSLAQPVAAPGTSGFTVVGSIAEPATTIEVDGNRLYTVADKTLKIFSVTNQVSPQLLGSVSFPERISTFVASGTTIYALDATGLRILDVSNPAAPILRGSMPLPGSSMGLAVPAPNVVLLANLSSGVNVIDVSDPMRPKRVASFIGDGYPRGVAAAGAAAYLTDWPTGLYILTLGKLDAPEVVKLLEGPSGQTGTDDPRTLTTVAVVPAGPSAPRTIVLAVDQGGTLHVFDVTRPASATETATLRLGSAPRRLKVQGTRAYFAAGAAGVQVIDLSNPATPAIAGAFETKGPARDVAVGDSVVYVATGSGEIVVLRERR